MTQQITATVDVDSANALSQLSEQTGKTTSYYVSRAVENLLSSFDTGKMRKPPIDFSKYVTPTERGKNADAYIKELRENDRV